MKIAFIGQKGIPAIQGGVEKHVEELSTRLAKQGHEVFVYVRNNYTDKRIKKYKGVKLIHLPSISNKNLDTISHTFLATLHAIFRRYDVIHYQAIGPSSLSFLIRIFKPFTSLVATFHCQDYYHQKWGWFAGVYLRFGEYITCKIPHKTIVISNILKNYVKKYYEKDAIVIPNGAEANPTKKDQALKIWNLKKKNYIISVSRLIRHKGIHYLIEAFKQLEDINKIPNNFKLVIVGDGFHTDDYVNYLKKISVGRKNIIFTGSQTSSNLEQLFSHAYLFVQPSESEGLSLSLLEAMGYGIAPLVSDIPENLDPIGECGFSFENKNVADLRDKIVYLLVKPEEVEKIGLLAKEKAEKQYSWDSIARKTAQVYEELISKKCLKEQYAYKSKKI